MSTDGTTLLVLLVMRRDGRCPRIVDRAKCGSMLRRVTRDVGRWWKVADHEKSGRWKCWLAHFDRFVIVFEDMKTEHLIALTASSWSLGDENPICDFECPYRYNLGPLLVLELLELLELIGPWKLEEKRWANGERPHRPSSWAVGNWDQQLDDG